MEALWKNIKMSITFLVYYPLVLKRRGRAVTVTWTTFYTEWMSCLVLIKELVIENLS